MYFTSDIDSDGDSDSDYPDLIFIRKPLITINTAKDSKDEVPPLLGTEDTGNDGKVDLESRAEDTFTDSQVTLGNSHIELEDDSKKQIVSHFMNEGDCPTIYEEIITASKNRKIRPRFFLDICNILYGARCESLIPVFANNEITLQDFLTISERELEELGVLPFQRKLLMDSIYRIHKRPYHPTSLHVVPLDEAYSNQDVAMQVLTLVKQMTAMQTTLSYLRNNYYKKDLTEADRVQIANHVKEIRKKMLLCKRALKQLHTKAVQWDKMCQPADLIQKHSKIRFRLTPNKIILAVICAGVSYKLWKSLS